MLDFISLMVWLKGMGACVCILAHTHTCACGMWVCMYMYACVLYPIHAAGFGLQDFWWTISLSGRNVRPQISHGTSWFWALIQAASFKESRSQKPLARKWKKESISFHFGDPHSTLYGKYFQEIPVDWAFQFNQTILLLQMKKKEKKEAKE